MSIRNPNDVRNRGGRILMPGTAPGTAVDDIAAQRAMAEKQMENHPFLHMLQDLQEGLKGVVVHNRMLSARFNALMDYLHASGILLSQPLDPESGLVLEDLPSTPESAVLFYDDLISQDLVFSRPPYGIERYVEEHMQHDHMMSMVAQALEGGAKMTHVLDSVREFNNNERRLRKMNANQFPLAEWLTMNPEALPEEELAIIADEFGLKKQDKVVTNPNVEPPVEVPEAPEVPEETDEENPGLHVVE